MRRALPLLLCALGALPARADYKAFAHVYPHFTQPEGNAEVEWWVGAETENLTAPGASTLYEHRIELEYGLTDRWDVSLYQVFQQPAGGAFTYDSVRLETRYQLTRKYQAPIDLLGYLEYERPADLREPNELEAKLIATKDFGRLFVQTNWIFEAKLALGDSFGYRLAMNGGVGFEFTPGFRVGVEALFNEERSSIATGAPYAETIHVGPSVSFARGRVWCVVTPAFHVAGTSTLEDRGQDLRFRFITGVQL